MKFLQITFKYVFVLSISLLFLLSGMSLYASEDQPFSLSPNSHLDFKKLRVIKLHRLQFGKVIIDKESRGTVTINPVNGSKTVTGAFNGGGRHGPAEFEIKGEPEKKFLVIFPGNIGLSGSNGVDPRVSEFRGFFSNSRNRERDDRVIGILGRDGKALLLVGGTVKIPPNHGDGEMSGSSDIVVEYLY